MESNHRSLRYKKQDGYSFGDSTARTTNDDAGVNASSNRQNRHSAKERSQRTGPGIELNGGSIATMIRKLQWYIFGGIWWQSGVDEYGIDWTRGDHLFPIWERIWYRIKPPKGISVMTYGPKDDCAQR